MIYNIHLIIQNSSSIFLRNHCDFAVKIFFLISHM